MNDNLITQEQSYTNQPPSSFSAYSEETDKLLRKWLQMQINQFYLNIIIKIIIFLFVIGSIIVTTVTLGPILESYIKVFSDLSTGTPSGFR
jgi:hypothetical protein